MNDSKSRYRADKIINSLSKKAIKHKITIGLTHKDISIPYKGKPDWGILGLAIHKVNGCVANYSRGGEDCYQAYGISYWNQEDLRKKLEKYGTLIESWYPIGHGDKGLINEEIFTKLAKKYKKTNVQIILRWHIQKGIIVFPKSSNPKHIKENSEIFDFQLNDDEMAEINKMGKKKRFFTMNLEGQKNFIKWKPED